MIVYSFFVGPQVDTCLLPGEGQRPIFDRDEIRQFVEEEKRSVNVLGKLSSADDRQREADRRNRGELNKYFYLCLYYLLSLCPDS